jgi:hypothetical protein
MEVYNAFEMEPASAYAISGLLIGIAVVVVFFMRSSLISAFGGSR